MADTPAVARVPLGFDGVVKLIAVPVTSLKLDPPTPWVVDTPHKSIPIEGTWSGFTENSLDATFIWVVRYDDRRIFEQPIQGIVKRSSRNPNRFEFHAVGPGNKDLGSPVLDTLAARLFQSGCVCWRLTVNYPHAEPAIDDSGSFRFDNPVELDVQEDDSGARAMGRELHLSPKLRRGSLSDQLLDAGMELRLALHPGAAEGKSRPVAESLHADWIWTRNDRDTSFSWRVGCAPVLSSMAEPEPILDYPELREVKEHLFAYTLRFATINQKDAAATVAKGPTQLFAVPRPALVSFSVKKSLEPPLTISAAGRVTGFDPGLEVPLVVTLWRSAERGKYQKLGSAKVKLKNQIFDAPLYVFPHAPDASLSDPLATWIAKYRRPKGKQPIGRPLFATLSFDSLRMAKRLPISAALDFSGFDGFDESRAMEVPSATAFAVCSSDPENGAALIADLMYDLSGF